MAKEVGVSLNPESFVEGGGLLDDVDVTIKEARFIMFDYEGKSPVAVPALKITFDPGDGELVTQCWSMGKATDWQPSKDGKKLIPIGSATAIVKTSNGGIFVTSLINAGFPGDRLAEGDISCLDGMEAHVIRTPAPERTGIEGQKKPATILIIDKIIALPGENKKKSGKATRSKGATKAAASGTGDNPAAEAAEKAITDLLILAEDGIDRADLITEVFKKVTETTKDGKLAKAAAQLAYSDDFLNADDRPWVVEDGVVKAVE